MKLPTANKRLQIDKAQSTLLLIIASATVLTVFCLMSSKALLSQGAYQRRLINAKQIAVKQLNDNVTSANSLVKYYDEVFNAGQINLIGGKNDPSPNAAPPNGTNGRLVLNGLPTTYDFPALVTSVAKIMADNGFQNSLPQGQDETDAVTFETSGVPEAATIDLSIAGSTNFPAAQKLLLDLERSIRPFDVNNLQFRGNESQMTVDIRLKSYFQPAKTLNIQTKEVL